MNRREALHAAAEFVAEALPVIVRRGDNSQHLALGIEIDGLPCQPRPLLEDPLLGRIGRPDYPWTRDRDETRDVVRAAIGQRWREWHREATAVWHRGPDAWADACVLVAGLEEPGRWVFGPPDERKVVLAALRLPVDRSWEPPLWTHAWIGFGGILDRLIGSHDDAVTRIEAAAAIVRAKIGRSASDGLSH